MEPTPGHSPGHQSVHITSAGAEALITGDVMHHPVQCCRARPGRAPFDSDADAARATRRALLDRYAGHRRARHRHPLRRARRRAGSSPTATPGGSRSDAWPRLLPPLLRPLHSDEYLAGRAPSRAGRGHRPRRAARCPTSPRTLALDAPTYAHDRRATALTLRAIDAAHGGGFYAVDEAAAHDPAAADAAFRRARPGGRRADPPRRPALWQGPHAGGARPLPADGGSASAGPTRSTRTRSTPPRGPRSCSARARPRSRCSRRRPGPTGENVLENAQIAAVRDVTDRYAGTGRVLTHTIVHPNLGPAELDRMGEWSRTLAAVGVEGVHARRTTDRGVADRRLVPRRRRDRHAVPRACARSSGRGSSARTRASADRCPTRRSRRRRHATSARRRRRSPTSTSSCTTRATSVIPTAPRVRSTRSRRAASTGSSRRRARTASARRQRLRRARQHLVPRAAPAGRGRARARQAAGRSSVPSASCGAPTAPGTDRRSR